MSEGSKPRIDRALTDPPPIPSAAITAANEVLASGRLFRYGEDSEAEPHAALLEEEFAAYLGAKYCVGLNSGGSSMFVAMKATGVEAGMPVLFNAFTLAPVPGSIAHAGGVPIPVEVGPDLRIDLSQLAERAKQSGAKHLLASHMRGHIADLGQLAKACKQLELVLIEDCAHTMGASWDGRMVGTFGDVACFSTQTFKHINSGEGGLLTTDDAEIAARAILYSGSYALYAQHRARPPTELIAKLHGTIPNCSLRLSNLAAALLRPQLQALPERAEIWRARYAQLAELLAEIPGVEMPSRDEREQFVPSSIQFFVPGLESGEIETLVSRCAERGVTLKWFGRAAARGFTARVEHWSYIADDGPLAVTNRALSTLLDMRIPLSLTGEECRIIPQVIRQAREGLG